MTLPHFAGLCAGIVVGTAVLTARQAAPAPGPRQEVVTDAVSSGSSKQTRNDVFAIDERGQRRLLETMESTQETLANGKSRKVETTSAPDANGRLGVTSLYTEETTTAASGRRDTVGIVLVPGVNGALQESRRTEATEREVRPGVVRVESTERVRGQSGGWETAEVRSRETRPVGPGDSLEDETIQRPDASGRLAVSQRNVTRRTEANGRVMEVTETFGDNRQGLTRPDTPMGLSQRVTKTTSAATGGRRRSCSPTAITCATPRSSPRRSTARSARSGSGCTSSPAAAPRSSPSTSATRSRPASSRWRSARSRPRTPPSTSPPALASCCSPTR